MPRDANNGKYKVRLCQSWIDTAKCHAEEHCPYAHSQNELTDAAVYEYGDFFKSRNCRQFFNNQVKHCNHAQNCLFRHEHRTMKQVHRRYYTSRLCAYEYLIKTRVSDKAQTKFLRNHESGLERLDVFKEIHEQGGVDLSDSSCSEISNENGQEEDDDLSDMEQASENEV